jgi:hydrogenase/urease accessory protein HupE
MTIEALDHLLYVFALCLAFSVKQWRKLIVLITAFTIGHSITLVLTSLHIVNINKTWVEFFIPVTIAITALLNILPKKENKQPLTILYCLALVFGLIHGMAFGANDLSMLLEGKELIVGVLGFNLGVELAQVIALLWFLAVSYTMVHMLQVKSRLWQIVLSSIILAYAVYLAIKYLP